MSNTVSKHSPFSFISNLGNCNRLATALPPLSSSFTEAVIGLNIKESRSNQDWTSCPSKYQLYKRADRKLP
jgi:hypothetical protein